MLSQNVFIPSRGRWEVARKLTQIWHNEGFDVHWVVEPAEHDKYFDAIVKGKYDTPLTPPGSPHKVFVRVLSVEDAGIGNSRKECVEIANNLEFPAIILADDDIKPGKNANMAGLLNCALHNRVLGITARYSYHDLCLGPGIKNRDDLILLPTGTFRLVALNVANVLGIGGYDPDLHGLEDNDLFLRGLKAGYPWMIHLGTWANSIGKRFDPGGLGNFMDVHGIDREGPFPWYAQMAERYPDIISGADTPKIRFAWRKAYDLYLPGWRRWSALHGGYLWYYLNENATI